MKNKSALSRTFICIDFPSKVIKEVARIQEIIQNNTTFTGKLTELENLHPTLKFLGEITPHKLQQVKQKLSTISFHQLDLRLSGTGTFNIKNKPKIVWIKVSGQDIFQLQKQIDNTLSEFFKPEQRFMSHLTIARIKYVKSSQSFISYINNMKPKPLKFSINSFKLKSSNLTPQGPIYKTIQKYELKNS